jgi:hypothetical protein
MYSSPASALRVGIADNECSISLSGVIQEQSQLQVFNNHIVTLEIQTLPCCCI